MIEGAKNPCTKMGEYGSQACTKAGELGGRAITWIAETSSSIASKIKEFASNILIPALKKLGESLSTLGRSITDAVKTNPKEFVVIAVVVGAISALVTAVAGFGISKALSVEKNEAEPSTSDLQNPGPNQETQTNTPVDDSRKAPEAGTD